MSGRFCGFVLCASLSLSVLADRSFAVPATKTQVLYLVQNASISTYDISYAGHAKKLATMTVGSAHAVICMTPSSNDHFVYVQWLDSNNDQRLSVFATNPQGALRVPAVQVISAANFQNFDVDPSNKFAYALVGWVTAQHQYIAKIVLFSVDANTGKLTQSKEGQSQYGPSRYGTAALNGFNVPGSKLFNTWGNTAGNSYQYSYRSHTVNAKTGELGPDFTIFKTAGPSGDVNSVSIGDKLIAQNYIPSGDSKDSRIGIFPNPAGNKQPLINCTSSMLDLCGDAYTLSALLDPAGKNLFLMPGWNNPDPATYVVQIDLVHKKLVSTGNSIPPQFTAISFSPDGLMVYGAEWGTGTSTIQIYGFNANSGTLTQGGQINAQASFMYPATRQ
jgi:hypothetical protein